MGTGPNKTLVVKLKDPAKKHFVFSREANLKEVKNNQGKSYFVADQLPEQLQEFKRQSQEIF